MFECWRSFGRKYYGAAALTIALVGCSLPFTSPPGQREYVHLVMAPRGPVQQENPAGDATAERVGVSQRRVLLVGEIGESGRGGGRQILFKTDAESIAPYQLTFWSRPLSDQIEEYLVRRIQQAELPYSVSYASSGIVGDFQLNVRIYDFYLDRENGANQIIARVRAELVNLQSRRLLDATLFEETVPISGEPNIEKIVVAFSDATERLISADILPWLLPLLEKTNLETTTLE